MRFQKKTVIMATLFVYFLGIGLGVRGADLTDGKPVDGDYYQAQTAPNSNFGGLDVATTFRIWIPKNTPTLRGILIRQHGCGEKACASGDTSADDLYWQAFATKWGLAVLGPRYYQPRSLRRIKTCEHWSDPARGSESVLFTMLSWFATQSNHPELTTIPWVLWGHSGGGFWVGHEALRRPERVVAVWYRSGVPDTPVGFSGVPNAALGVPMFFNAGIHEISDPTVSKLYYSGLQYFSYFRSRGGLFGVALDPVSGHDCRDSRYLAAQFFDACLRERLPDKPGTAELKPMNAGIFAPAVQDLRGAGVAFPAGLQNWYPNEDFRRQCEEYRRTAWVTDTTPPPAPIDVRVDASGVVTWKHSVDLESGLSAYLFERDGKTYMKYPSVPYSEFGRPTFQENNYYDTPNQPRRPASFRLPQGFDSDGKSVWTIRAVNGEGLVSEPVSLTGEPEKETVSKDSDDESAESSLATSDSETNEFVPLD